MPSPVVMVSAPPTVASVVSTRARVIGRVPHRSVFGVAAVIRPLSPSTTLLPLPALIVSPPVPPMTTSSPLPVVMVSAPPYVTSMLQIRSRSPGSPSSSTVSTKPWSAMTMFGWSVVPAFSPSFVVIASPPAPPSTMSEPRPVEMVSLPPIVGSTVMTRPTRPSTPSVVSPKPPCPETAVATASSASSWVGVSAASPRFATGTVPGVNHRTRPRSPTTMSPPVPVRIVSAPCPPKMTRGSEDPRASTESSSGPPSRGTAKVSVCRRVTSTTTNEAAPSRWVPAVIVSTVPTTEVGVTSTPLTQTRYPTTAWAVLPRVARSTVVVPDARVVVTVLTSSVTPTVSPGRSESNRPTRSCRELTT